MDEADKFNLDPEEWFSVNKNEIKDFTRVVMFENLYAKLTRLQSEMFDHSEMSYFMKKFRIEEKFFHTFIEQSERTGKSMMLLGLTNTKGTFIGNQENNLKEDL